MGWPQLVRAALLALVVLAVSPQAHSDDSDS
jgi:hypothetical protein